MKNLFVLLIIIITFLVCYISPSYAVERDYPRFPKVELSFRRARWFILFNEIYPRTRFAFVVKNIISKKDIDINEGVLILEIAEDTGLATEPNQDEFRFLAYKPFDTIKTDTQLKLFFTLSEKYKPGRFRIKPTLFVYPKGKSSFRHAYETMKNLGLDAFRAWEYSYFSEWEKNLPELGALRKEQGSYLITIRRFYDVLGGTGLSFLLIICIVCKGGRKLIIKLFKKLFSLQKSNPDNSVTEPLSFKSGCIDKETLNNGSIKKKLYVCRITKGGYSLGDVYNKSDEDIIDLDITLEYVDKMGVGRKVEAKIINSYDEPIWAKPYICHLIKKKENKYIIDFPGTKTKVIIRGKIAESEEILTEEFEVPSV